MSRLPKAYADIYARAKQMGVTPNQLQSLSSYQWLQQLCNQPVLPTALIRNVGLAAGLLWLVLTLTVIFLDLPIAHERVVELYFDWFHDTDYVTEMCLVPQSYWIPYTQLARPPSNCSICQGLTHIERISDLSPHKFESIYAYTGHPVIVTDAMHTWKAQDVMTFTYLKSLYSNDSNVFFDSVDCQFFGYTSGFDNLSHAFSGNASADNSAAPWYFGWGNCDSSAANQLRTLYDRPYFLPQGSELVKTDWIFLGSPGYGAPMHVDQVDHPSWQAQVMGIKQWALEPPAECYHICERSLKATVHPGEIIVAETRAWFHSTYVEPGNISIAIGSEYD